MCDNSYTKVFAPPNLWAGGIFDGAITQSNSPTKFAVFNNPSLSISYSTLLNNAESAIGS
jgi:hypothetical protein